MEGAIVRGHPFRVAGWGLGQREGIARVEITLDGDPVSRARIGLPRPDLADVSRHVDAPIAGFEHLMDPLMLPGDPARDGARHIGATVHHFDGQSFEIPPRAVTFEMSNEDPYPSAWRPVSGSALRPGSRLCAFTHSLLRNGATLHLLELLRSLSEPPAIDSVVVAPEDGPLSAEFRDAGIPVHLCGPYVFDDPGRYEALAGSLSAWMAENDVGIVISHGSPCFIGVDVARRHGLPSIYWIGGGFTPREFFPTYLGWFPHPRIWERIAGAFRSADVVVFLAEVAMNRYVAHGIVDPGRAIAVGPWLDPRRSTSSISAGADVRADRRIPPEARLILSVGAMAPLKGHGMLAQSFRHLAEADTSLVLIGDPQGAYVEAIRDYLVRTGLSPRSWVIPPVQDLQPWFGAADLFAFASDSEGGPRVVLEAMSQGLPVVTTRVGDVASRIRDGASGFLVEPRDAAALSTALAEALSSPPADLRRVAEAGRDLARSLGEGTSPIRRYRALLDELRGSAEVGEHGRNEP